jgi:hydroxyethylthiazole kinase-like uncharacterized protein yjeF
VPARRLFPNIATRQLEAWANTHLPAHTLMQRAGLAVARLAIAIAPHAHVIWIACGPGNNGGDGYEAARHLKLWGKRPVVTASVELGKLPPDAAASRQRAIEVGVVLAEEAPGQYDLCIDAMFGIGNIRGLDARHTKWIDRINSLAGPVLAVDLPSGLDAERGTQTVKCVRADYTLSLLTLKPGQFTADGRDACGEIWFNNLGVVEPDGFCAELNAEPQPMVRGHNTHKGSFGEVGIFGGAQGMAGAALLAALAALNGGAGRVYLTLLDTVIPRLDPNQPEIMFRDFSELSYESMVIVAGCGGGISISEHLDELLDRSTRLVLDADALNSISRDASLQHKLAARKLFTTVLTPHPLEAARLMGIQTADVQANRLQVAQAMADRFSCTVVLKGSGTVIAAPGKAPRINPTGNARLATAGTGDVLAGLIGARLTSGLSAFQCACESVYLHGRVADKWNKSFPMTAHDLASNL